MLLSCLNFEIFETIVTDVSVYVVYYFVFLDALTPM